VFRIRFPKYKKGGFTVTPVKDKPTYGICTCSISCIFVFMCPIDACQSWTENSSAFCKDCCVTVTNEQIKSWYVHMYCYC